MTDDAVAIVGMSCRFAGASDLDRYWDVLQKGKETLTRGLSSGATTEDGMQPVDAFGVLSDIECFDSAVFGITPREAKMMDPQQRVWLELVWHALEDAGLGHRRNLLTGVYAGCNRSAYLEKNILADAELAHRLRDHVSSETRQIRNGNERDFLPLRTSFAFDLDGPSVNIQSACSTALVSVATACASLERRETDVCVAGGISIARTTAEPVFVEPEAIHSTTGYCRPFADFADGTVFGDGGGVVVLRRIDDAIADGQRVYCVIRGWGVTNDGGSKSSFAAPEAGGQARAIRSAWKKAGIDTKNISYVEAHGTATRVGDPIEFESLLDALGKRGVPCRIGSVKANIGHTDTAAGIAGLIKTALMIYNRQLVPMPGVERPNPLLGIEGTRFEIATRPERWVAGQDEPLCAGVTALGVGGTNCHLALSEAQIGTAPEMAETQASKLLLVSAADNDALDRQIEAYQKTLSTAGDDIADLCQMSIRGRRHLRHRVAVVGCDAADLSRQLGSARGRSGNERRAGKPLILFAFTGQLSTYSGVARELYEWDSAFARSLESCAQILDPVLDRSLFDILFEHGDSLTKTSFEQPALCAVQIALAEMWKALGIRPAAVLGYSVGEFAAAHAVGAAPLEPLLRFVARRGAMMEEIAEPGYLAVIRAPRDVIEDFCARNRVEIAGTPAPGLTMVAGRGAPDKVVNAFPQPGAVKVVSDRYGFHSDWLVPCLGALRNAAEAVPWQRPSIPFASTQSGTLATEFTPDYWVEHARNPVRFQDALACASAAGTTLALEIGPRPVLTALAAETDINMPWWPSLTGKGSDWDAHLRCLAGLFEAGADLDWSVRFPNRPRTWVDLPKYDFSRRTFWTGPLPSEPSNLETTAVTETWSEDTQPHFSQHRLFGRTVVPASHHVSWILDRLADHFGHSDFVVFDWIFQRPAVLPKGAEIRVALRLDADTRGGDFFGLVLLEEGVAQPPFVTARVHLEKQELPVALDTTSLDEQFPTIRSGDRFYREHWTNLEGTGECFRLIERVWSGDDRAVAEIRRPDRSMAHAPNAEVIEAAFQCLHAGTEIETQAAREAGELWVPYSIGRVAFRAAGPAGLAWCSADHQATRRTETNAVADIALYDAAGMRLVEISDFHLRPIRKGSLGKSEEENPCFETVLEPVAPLTSKNTPPVPTTWCWDRDSVLALIGDSIEHAPADEPFQLAELFRRVGLQGSRARLAFVSSARSDEFAASASRLYEAARCLGEVAPDIKRFCVFTSWRDRAPSPDEAAVEALARVILNEYPNWDVRLIGQETLDANDRWRELLSELLADGTDRQVAWLSGHRYRRKLRPLELPDMPVSFSAAKSYLVIGRDNAQSRSLRDWIAKDGAGHVAFLHAGQDVRKAISPAIAQANEQLPLGGVFFLPWGAGEGLIARLTTAEFDTEVSECAAALDSVSQAVRGLSVDHFVCFSSSAAVLGVQGQASYAAMTGWMDAFCASRRANGLPGLAIDWGPWEGMGHWTKTEQGRQAIFRQGWRPIRPEVGFETMARAMAGDRAQVHALQVDWSILGASGYCRLFSTEAATPVPKATAVSPSDELSRLIGEDMSGHQGDTTLVELGLDSLMAVRLRNFLKANLGRDVPLIELLSTTTLQELANLGAADKDHEK